MIKKNVLYYLGAGASYSAIPVLDQWNSSMVEFKQYVQLLIDGLEQNSKLSDEEKQRLKPVLKEIFVDLEWLVNNSSSQYSVDTYAKKLFIKGDEKSLDRLKKIVTLFLIFCQTQDQYAIPHGNGNVTRKTRSVRDPRYETLLSFLLGKGHREIPENVKFVSWNYDAQVELALSEFANNSEDVLQSVTHNRRQFLKINGTAGVIPVPRSSLTAPSTAFHWLFHRKYVVEQLLALIYDTEGPSQGISKGIKYAWENEEFDFLDQQLTTLGVDSVDFVVLIGYSFPFFNREVDSRIFSRLARGRATAYYLQYPDGEHETILERIESMEIPGLEIRLETTAGGKRNFFLVRNTGTFYVPHGT